MPFLDFARRPFLDFAARDAGIPGAKFWDAGSRAAEGGTRNFTVWDDSILTTLKRNDEPIGLLAGGQ